MVIGPQHSAESEEEIPHWLRYARAIKPEALNLNPKTLRKAEWRLRAPGSTWAIKLTVSNRNPRNPIREQGTGTSWCLWISTCSLPVVCVTTPSISRLHMQI